MKGMSFRWRWSVAAFCNFVVPVIVYVMTRNLTYSVITALVIALLGGFTHEE